MKTLDPIEHRSPINANTTPGTVLTIYAPGSYCLTENLLGAWSGVGLTVHVSNVTIDLNGFSQNGR